MKEPERQFFCPKCSRWRPLSECIKGQCQRCQWAKTWEKPKITADDIEYMATTRRP